MIYRNLTKALLGALAASPVVLLHGPRQSGKSTLAQWLAETRHRARYFTLDDAAVLAAANRDPAAFLGAMDGPVVIDEVQLAPDLFRAIKLEVDRNRRPGRFLLTGSADPLLIPRLSESLVGRMEIHTLWPLSHGETEGSREGFVDAVFARTLPLPEAETKADRQAIVRAMLIGGYPEVSLRHMAPQRRQAWFGSYITTILQRDIRAMADIEGLALMPRLLGFLAAQAGGLLNIAELSRDAGISQPTIKRYIALLQAAHLFRPVSTWSGNVRKRLIKTAKVYLNDTGLLAYLLGVEDERIVENPNLIGPLLESFVFQELSKQVCWSSTKPGVFYYRTASGREVDFVLEDRRGRIVGIEVKAQATLRAEDLRGLEDLSRSAGRRFLRGVVLYLGAAPVPFARNIHVLPLDSLWRLGAAGTANTGRS